MRKVDLLLFLLLTCNHSALATRSVTAVDRATGRVVIASSTGSTEEFLNGVSACQAGVDSATHQNQMLVFDELPRATEPARAAIHDKV
jgi:hypothetical protein